MKDLHYIMSGPTFIRVNRGVSWDPVVVDIVTKAYEKLNNKPGHKFGMLYNAYTEKRIGECIHDPVVHKYDIEWHADSGGLQIITAGMDITDELKDEIYKFQATHSDIAMCFDEIPLHINEELRKNLGSAARTSLEYRTFVHENLKQCGTNTGNNINRQCEVFDSLESTARIMVIVQGNSFDDFREYFDATMKQIDKKYHHMLAGVAIADTCIGMGTLEATDLIASYKLLDIPDEMGTDLHLLGVGSISRIAPAMQLSSSGYLDCDISYDSTTHSSMFIMGGKYLHSNGDVLYYSRQRCHESDIIIADIYDTFGDIISPIISKDEMIKVTGEVDFTSTVQCARDDPRKSQAGEILVVMNAAASVNNFMNKLDDTFKTSEYIPSNRKLLPMYYLKDVKTMDDYRHWRDTFSGYMSSKRIRRVLEAKHVCGTHDFF